MEKYETPKMEVIEIQNDVILCCSSDNCCNLCPTDYSS